MIYRVRHVTTYDYEDPVSVSHHILRLTPHNSLRQTCRQTGIMIAPQPIDTSRHVDYFGNATIAFTLLEPHDRLVVEATSELEVNALALPDFAGSPHSESVRDSLPFARTDEELNAYQFVFDSTRGGQAGVGGVCARVVSRGSASARSGARSDAANQPRFPIRYQGD